MPLLPGKKNIGHNISEMEEHGHPYNQARAAALHKAYDAKGGEVEKEEHEESDGDLHEGVMKEMMGHMEKGDHKQALESLKALINACHNCKE